MQDTPQEIIKTAIGAVGSRKELARACGVSLSAVSKWLWGAARPTAENATAIEMATGGAVRRVDLVPEPYIGMIYADESMNRSTSTHGRALPRDDSAGAFIQPAGDTDDHG
jgi:DNA-binding transcriptional regulator YdaS (Cro superfamily)